MSNTIFSWLNHTVARTGIALTFSWLLLNHASAQSAYHHDKLMVDIMAKCAERGVTIVDKSNSPLVVIELAKVLLESQELDCYRNDQDVRYLLFGQNDEIIITLESRYWLTLKNQIVPSCAVALKGQPIRIISTSDGVLVIELDKFKVVNTHD